jgi:hypothetical protein
VNLYPRMVNCRTAAADSAAAAKAAQGVGELTAAAAERD